MLKSHGRYDYSAIAKRPDYSFPDGRRLAVHFCLNLEHFSFGEGLGNDYGTNQPQPNVRSYAWRDYGNRVGAWRLLELAEAYDLPYGVLLNTALYDYCPELVAAFSARGDEIVGQLYNFVDKGGREVALRPEMTPTVARMVAARANALTNN